jgi:glycosyltransferase involved in cell wall biosynthesis
MLNSKKKIFVAVTNDISTDQRVHKVSNYLFSKGFDVLVYGRILPTTFSVKRKYTIKRKKHFFNHNFLFYAEYNFRLFFKLLFYKCDYILANDLDVLPACFVASKFKKTELIYDSHELFSEGPELQGRNFVKGFWKTLENFFLPRIKKSYTVSQSIADYYYRKHNANFGVVRNVPLLKRKTIKVDAKFPTENKTVLYQGVLNPGRGIKPMIKALHFLKEIDLVIIGYGKVEEELRQFVKDEILENRVHFLGRIPQEELPNYTKLATIGMVLEEPLGLSFEYSLPNKLFDYIHSGLPIICGSLPEIKKVVETYKVGVVVEDYAPETIAEKIQELVDNEALYYQIKLNQQKIKKGFCWENEQQLLDNYFY